MATEIQFLNVNWFAIVVCSIFSHILGFIWFGPLFGKLWLKYSGWKMDDIKKRSTNMGVRFATAYFLNGFMIYVLALLIHALQIETYTGVVGLVFVIYFGFIAPFQFYSVLWEGHKIEFYLINTSQRLAILLLGGSIYYLMS